MILLFTSSQAFQPQQLVQSSLYIFLWTEVKDYSLCEVLNSTVCSQVYSFIITFYSTTTVNRPVNTVQQAWKELKNVE